MSKIILQDTNSGHNLQTINDNFRKIEDEFNKKVLYRDNPVGEPNEMESDLDMNSHRIYNLPEPVFDHEAARKKDVGNAPLLAKQYAEEAKGWAEEAEDTLNDVADALLEGTDYLGEYLPNLVIDSPLQFFWRDGSYYRISGDIGLPYTTTGDWGSEEGLFVAVGTRGVVAVDSIADLLALPTGQRKEDLRYLVKGYYAGTGIGGGEFYWDASADKSTADGGKVVDPDALAGFDGTPTSRDGFLNAQGSGTGTGCYVLLSVPSQMNYGCVGDGAFDDSDAVQKAIDAQVTFIDKEHAITKSLYVYDSVDMSAATLVCDNQPITYMTIGEVSKTTRQKLYGIPYMRNTLGAGYVIDNITTGSVGVRFISIHESRIVHHPSGVIGFDTGVELYCEGPGFSYTEFKDLRVINCRRHVSFHTVGNGWITECLFLKLKTANYDNFCHPDTDLSDEGVNYLHVNASPFHAVENITFISPTLEGRWVSTHIEAVAGSASGWCMISPRFEVPGTDFRVVGSINDINVINPSNTHKVTGMIGDGRILSFGVDGVVSGNAPVILGGARGDKMRQGIGLLNENFDFSDRAPLSITPNSSEDFIWNINKRGFYARGIIETPDAPGTPPRLAIHFLQQYIQWGLPDLASGRPTVGLRAERLFDPILGAITVDTDVLQPEIDGVSDLGRAGRRWRNVYASSGTIITSDGRLKQDIRDITEAERSVAQRLRQLIRAYRFKDAVDTKGEDARIHFGVIAQDVADAFTSEGLDPHRYGLFCYDEWEATEEVLDENGEIVTPYSEAGDRFGIRYDELLAFIISAL